ncbi:MAG: DUF4011 domain-containing protein, partial [Christensenellaceae bacterium]|nr:DUF4011 domain-containing protein [Christensenellaceae bacterium]
TEYAKSVIVSEEEQVSLDDLLSNKALPRSSRDGGKTRLTKEIDSIKYLIRENEAFEKETGRNELYLGYPFVFGNINQDTPVAAPLILFPVDVVASFPEVTLKHSADRKLFLLNKAFILAYAKEKGLKTDNIVQEFQRGEESNPKDVRDVLETLRARGFKISQPSKKGFVKYDDLDEITGRLTPSDSFEVKNCAVIGRFPLANSIYSDYLALEKDELTSPSIKTLLDSHTLNKPKASNENTRYFEMHDLDYAQENAIKKLEEVDNIVIFGPPGTGKSQTIANIICDSLVKRKRVLVVSQKRAALDVVYNRLGTLSSKAMLIPDPEKERTAFYEKMRTAHLNTLKQANFTPLGEKEDAKTAHEAVFNNIKDEIRVLSNIANALFEKTPFGLSLQEMYAESYNITSNEELRLLADLKATNFYNADYYTIRNDLKLIRDKNLIDTFVSYQILSNENPFTTLIDASTDMHKLREARTLVKTLLEGDLEPFKFSSYPRSRYLLPFYYEKPSQNRREIRHIATLLTDSENKALYNFLKASALPPLWLAYPFVKTKYNKRREDVIVDLNIAKNALDEYAGGFGVLSSILNKEGFAVAISGIMNGNRYILTKLSEALEGFVKTRDLSAAITALSDSVKEILQFCSVQGGGGKVGMQSTLDKILPLRVYAELIKESEVREEFLAKTVTFQSLRSRIIALKDEERKYSKMLAAESFAKEYAYYFNGGFNGDEKTDDRHSTAKDFLYEIQRTQKYRPLRNVLNEFDEYLLRLFPVWLLSPEVVSTVFPLKPGLFDLVVFDEASQIFIEAAIPSIYRGKKVVVAGDNKQLRPTRTFIKRYTGNDETYADDLSTQAALEVESLLDLASARYPQVALNYHYRSAYAALIDFSNAAFYDNKLQIAPDIKPFATQEPPIERIFVKGGLWKHRRNADEAREVVKLLKKILTKREERETIGIVTFNTEQQEYIEDLIDEEAENNRNFARLINAEKIRTENGESVGIFVKNLENVQGEERDIIIFSVGYARNEDGAVYANFGSLSLEGGENRLNVAVTRAKKKVYVVTSIEPEELDRAETAKNNGPRLLKKYLQYARAVSDKDKTEINTVLTTLKKKAEAKLPVGEYAEKLRDALIERGYKVDYNLGNTEYKLSLAVYDEESGKYILGIECDNEAYRTSESVLERDVYRPKFLENRGMKIIRVWSRDCWISKEHLISDIEDAIIAAKQGG